MAALHRTEYEWPEGEYCKGCCQPISGWKGGLCGNCHEERDDKFFELLEAGKTVEEAWKLLAH